MVLSKKEVKDLIDDPTFITALVPKLKAGADVNGFYTKTDIDASFVRTNGSNATEAGVNAMLGKLTDKVVKTSELKTKAAEKDVVEAIFDSEDNGTKISETKIGATFAKKTDLDNKVNVAGNNATEAGVNAMLGKLTDKVVKTSELKTKAAEKDVVEAIFDSEDNGTKISETKIGATFAKKTDLDNKVNVAGNNATEDGVNAMLGKLTDKVVKTGELATRVAEKAVVDVLVPALATVGTDDTKKVYTKETANTAFFKTADLGTKVAEKTIVEAIIASTDFPKFVKESELKTKAAEKDVVENIFDAKDGNDKISEIKIGATFAKKNASNLTDSANQKAFAEAILPAKDGNKSILVDKLEGFLAENVKAYSNNTKTAKELLVPSSADLVQDHDFKQSIEKSIKEMAVSSNSDFEKNVREVVSQPSFEILPSDEAALNWTW